MSDIRLVRRGASGSVQRVGSDSYVGASAFADGALVTGDWIMALALEGRVFTASVGTITTPITFGAYDAGQPEFALAVPSGTLVIPLSIQVHLEDSAGTDNEVLFITSTVTATAGTSTAVTPVNHLNGSSVGTQCTAYSAFSGNGTDPTTGTVNEFWRWGNAFADANTQPARVVGWNWRDYAPVAINGVGSLVGYVSATTTQAAGFLKVTWAELPSTSIT